MLGLLLEAGADPNAEADVYGGGATPLGLTATSVHPFKAGVQNDLIDVLLKHGARLDDPRGAGNQHDLVTGAWRTAASKRQSTLPALALR